MKKLKIFLVCLISISVIISSYALLHQTDYDKNNETLALSSGQSQSFQSDASDNQQKESLTQDNVQKNSKSLPKSNDHLQKSENQITTQTNDNIAPESADDVYETDKQSVAGKEDNTTKNKSEATETVSPDYIPKNICSLVIRCDSALSKNNGKNSAILPQSGIILKEEKIEFGDGETVFEVLLKTVQHNGVSINYTKNSLYNSVYIKEIGGLSEFDFGNFSGWLYKVNGVSPTYGCSQYKVKSGDIIEFYYSC